MAARDQIVADAPGPGTGPAHPECAASDEILAAAAARGDRGSFDALVERYGDRVFRFVVVRVRDRHDAEEVVQEAFLRAWGAIGRYDGRWRFSTWLYTIARREAVSVVRGRGRRVGGVGEVEEGVLSPALSRGARERGREGGGGRGVWDVAAGVLGREEYEAMWLRYVEERSAAEIAVILGRNAVAVRVMLHRARERVRGALSREEGR